MCIFSLFFVTRQDDTSCKKPLILYENEHNEHVNLDEECKYYIDTINNINNINNIHNNEFKEQSMNESEKENIIKWLLVYNKCSEFLHECDV